MDINPLKTDTLFKTGLITLFAIITLVGILHHEIWLDEAHHWLLARDSSNLMELWKNTRYEGHPLLWNLILFVVTRFGQDPVWMQMTHLIISTIALTLFVLYSPFPKYWKALFIFGYFTLYEYTLISRNYSLILLFFFLSLIFLSKKNLIGLGISLFFLANTHLFGLILSAFLALLVLFQFYINKDQCEKKSKKELGLFMLIFLVGAFLSAWQILPPSDSPFQPHVSALFSFTAIERSLAVFVKSFIPIPDFADYNFWNSNFITATSKPLAGFLSILIILILFGTLADKKNLLLLFVGFTFSLLFIVIVLYPVSIVQAVRHFGLIYITFIGCLWILLGEHPENNSFKFYPRIKKAFITALLAIQCIAGWTAYYYDLNRPFSESENVVEFLKQNKLDKLPVLTLNSHLPSISSYLKRKIYSMPSEELVSYFKWEEKNTAMNVSEAALIRSAKTFVKRSGNIGILITYGPVPTSEGIVLLKVFRESVVKAENYYVYKITSGSD